MVYFAGECLKWKSCLQKVQLMTAPHSEIGSHDDMSFTQRQVTVQCNCSEFYVIYKNLYIYI